VNHGIGGSVIPENTALVDRLIFPLEPKVIVFYAGDNDIAKNRSSQQVADDWAAYVKAVRAKLPEVKLVYISIKPSLARWKLWPKIQEANAKLKVICEAEKDMKFIDVSKVMLGDDGLPIKALFREDGLHMKPAGYERWVKLVGPEIEEAAKP
jgi:lysophospholipase L1-like esterase